MSKAPRDERSFMLRVPIYEVSVELVLTSDIALSRNTPDRIVRYGGIDRDGNVAGYVIHEEDRFGVFLDRHDLSHSVLDHETFHLTHRIMERCGAGWHPSSHEPYAYLHGWLSKKIYLKLKEWHARIRT